MPGDPSPACNACGAELGGPSLVTPDRQGTAAGEFEVRVCRECGSGTTLPAVAESDLGAYYSDAYGPHESGVLMQRLAGAVMAARLRGRLFEPLRDGSAGAVLDVGSGRGDLLRVLQRRGATVTGLEPSPDAARAAEGFGVKTVVGTLADAELPQGSFDAVIFHHSLEHVTRPVEALEKVRGLLEPGGTIFIAVPNFASRSARRRGEAWWALDVPRHRTHFTPQGLESALRRAGLRVRLLKETASVLGPAANLQERLRGSFLGSGPVFLMGYGFALGFYPLVWGVNEVRGGGEFLVARAGLAAEPEGKED
ncbi:MAG TPA: class I SAM-dependent methyltransferase [Solirubrobacterales bacterium]|nr:class I SAM-dependent methyltransferase [Solirubrobacterales bacterium]